MIVFKTDRQAYVSNTFSDVTSLLHTSNKVRLINVDDRVAVITTTNIERGWRLLFSYWAANLQ